MTCMARSIHRILWIAGLTLSFVISGGGISVHAEREHGYDRDHFSSPHWELDGRHGQNITTRLAAITSQACRLATSISPLETGISFSDQGCGSVRKDHSMSW